MPWSPTVRSTPRTSTVNGLGQPAACSATCNGTVASYGIGSIRAPDPPRAEGDRNAGDPVTPGFRDCGSSRSPPTRSVADSIGDNELGARDEHQAPAIGGQIWIEALAEGTNRELDGCAERLGDVSPDLAVQAVTPERPAAEHLEPIGRDRGEAGVAGAARPFRF
jgi:hypothetical protein